MPLIIWALYFRVVPQFSGNSKAASFMEGGYWEMLRNACEFAFHLQWFFACRGLDHEICTLLIFNGGDVSGRIYVHEDVSISVPRCGIVYFLRTNCGSYPITTAARIGHSFLALREFPLSWVSTWCRRGSDPLIERIFYRHAGVPIFCCRVVVECVQYVDIKIPILACIQAGVRRFGSFYPCWTMDRLALRNFSMTKDNVTPLHTSHCNSNRKDTAMNLITGGSPSPRLCLDPRQMRNNYQGSLEGF